MPLLCLQPHFLVAGFPSFADHENLCRFLHEHQQVHGNVLQTTLGNSSQVPIPLCLDWYTLGNCRRYISSQASTRQSKGFGHNESTSSTVSRDCFAHACRGLLSVNLIGGAPELLVAATSYFTVLLRNSTNRFAWIRTPSSSSSRKLALCA